MILQKGDTLFRQGESGPLYKLVKGILKIVRVHQDGSQFMVNIIVPGDTIPHHSLISPNPYYGTAIALVPSEVEVIATDHWYKELAEEPERYKDVAMALQNSLRMMQKRIDQLTEVSPAAKLEQLRIWIESYIAPSTISDILTQDEIGQFIGLRRETINRLMRKTHRQVK